MPSLSEQDRVELLRLARRSIEEAVLHDRLPGEIPRTSVFGERRGVFVTLHVHERLRGCIGVVDPDDPLGECVARCAVSAALNDPRFSPVQEEELADLNLEISLLTPPQLIRPEEIEVGRHGLLVERGPQRGLLLPQVATEHHFTRERFLEETCRKAGLPPKAWQDASTSIFGFEGEVFAEPKKSPART